MDAQLGVNLSFGSLDLAYRFKQHAAFSPFLVGATPGCNLPDDLASRMLFALLDTGMALR
jgi:methionine synthase I (cobalamin-dependent)